LQTYVDGFPPKTPFPLHFTKLSAPKAFFYNILAKNIYIYAMAIPINSIPALKGKEALDFVEAAESNYKKKGSVDFSAKIRIADSILKKAR
jgi:hypothetical protein